MLHPNKRLNTNSLLDEIKKLQELIAAHSLKIAGHQQAITGLLVEMQRQKAAGENLPGRLNELVNAVNKHQKDVAELQLDIKRALLSIDEFEKQINQLRKENNRLRTQRLILGVSSIVLPLITFLVVPKPEKSPIYHGIIRDTAELRRQVDNYRGGDARTTNVNYIAFRHDSIIAYYRDKYNGIISRSGLGTTPGNGKTWAMFYYFFKDNQNKMRMAIMPGLVDIDARTGEITESYDYFNDSHSVYRGAQIDAYDFGHLKP